jgi:hypothetical protein
MAALVANGLVRIAGAADEDDQLDEDIRSHIGMVLAWLISAYDLDFYQPNPGATRSMYGDH